MRYLTYFCLTVLLSILLAGCAPYIPNQGGTTSMAETPEATPSPTPIPMSEFFPNMQARFQTGFDDQLALPDTWTIANTEFQDGIAVVRANQDWTGIFTDYEWSSGDTLLWRFRFAARSQANISVTAGEWQTSSFRQWGILNNHGYILPHFWEGDRYLLLGWQEDRSELLPNHWYVLAIHIGSFDEPFVVRIWDQDAPDDFVETRQAFDDPGWANVQWNAGTINGPTGELDIDQFEAIQGLPDFSAP